MSINSVRTDQVYPVLKENQSFNIADYIKNRDDNTSLIARICQYIVKLFKSLFANGDRPGRINKIIAEKIFLGKNAKERHVLHVAFKHIFKEESFLKNLGINKEKVLSRDALLDVAGLNPEKYAQKELDSFKAYIKNHPDSAIAKINIEKYEELLKKELASVFSKIIKTDRTHSQRLLLDDELSLKEQEGLDILIKVSNSEGQLRLSNKETRKLKVFLKDAQGNMSLNRRIENLLESLFKDKFDDKKMTALSSIHTFTYKTKNIKSSIKSADKLTALVEVIKKNPKAEIPYKDKLELEEMGLITSMLKLKGLLSFLDSAGFIDDNSRLKTLLESLTKARTAMNYVDGKFIKQVDYRSGDLIMHRGGDHSRFINSDLDKMTRWQLSWLGSDYYHTGIVNAAKKKMRISHVTDKKYEYNDAKAAQSTYTDAFRLKFDALIDDTAKPVLDEMAKQKNKKQTWDDLVGSKFRAIIEKMHEDRTAFEKIKNTKWRRLMSGIMPHTRKDWLFREVPKSFDRPFFEEGKNQMICSEFAAKVLISALVELKKELKKEMAAFISTQEKISVDEALEKVGDNIIAMPIPETEKLKRLNTARLMDFLLPHLTQVKKAPILDQLVAGF